MYRGKNKKSLDNANVIKRVLNIKLLEKEKIELGNVKIEMKTTYPGLLLGSGYNHDSGLEGDFKLGFFFDYTTGMPIIPGSCFKECFSK